MRWLILLLLLALQALTVALTLTLTLTLPLALVLLVHVVLSLTPFVDVALDVVDKNGGPNGAGAKKMLDLIEPLEAKVIGVRRRQDSHGSHLKL
mgnify:CR=1 FL=1